MQEYKPLHSVIDENISEINLLHSFDERLHKSIQRGEDFKIMQKPNPTKEADEDMDESETYSNSQNYTLLQGTINDYPVLSDTNSL